MASSSADCVFGVARLISSASTIWAMIGPGRNSNSRSRWLKIDTPVTSLGSMSGVNWMRRNEQPMDLAIGARQHRLADARHVFDQQMALAQEGDEGHLHFAALAEDDLLDILNHAVRKGTDHLDVGGGLRIIHAVN